MCLRPHQREVLSYSWMPVNTQTYTRLKCGEQASVESLATDRAAVSASRVVSSLPLRLRITIKKEVERLLEPEVCVCVGGLE